MSLVVVGATSLSFFTTSFWTEGDGFFTSPVLSQASRISSSVGGPGLNAGTSPRDQLREEVP